MICPNCKGSMVELFLSMACKNECDLKPQVEDVLAGILAHTAHTTHIGSVYWHPQTRHWWSKTDFWRDEGPTSRENIARWWKFVASDWEWAPCAPPSDSSEPKP
jgi:hypothetical protein